MVTAINILLCQTKVKPSFVIFDTRPLTLMAERQSAWWMCKWGLNPVWHRMFYSCNHMSTVGVKGL